MNCDWCGRPLDACRDRHIDEAMDFDLCEWCSAEFLSDAAADLTARLSRSFAEAAGESRSGGAAIEIAVEAFQQPEPNE